MKVQTEVTSDRPEESCGIFGIYSQDKRVNAAAIIYLGLFALQHRGQESAGMVVSDGQRMAAHKDMGLVSRVFTPDILNHLGGRIGIGHVRYAVSGSSYLANAEPLMGDCAHGIMAVAHNGLILNNKDLRRELLEGGSIFQTSTDTEVIMNLIARHSRVPLEEAVTLAVERLAGAFSLVLMTRDTLIGVRDSYGIRPVCLGKLGDSYILASESCVFSSLGGQFLRELAPGEMVIINHNGLETRRLGAAANKALCVFEYIYFARPDSIINGRNIHRLRQEMGKRLAEEFTGEADLVIPIPETGVSAALGFSEASGIPYDTGLIKNNYVGRTFIRPGKEERDLVVRIKLNPVEEIIKGRRIVIIDDTIVRGTTTEKLVGLLREVGAREVHVCISSPPITHPCFYGIDTSARKELIASHHSKEEIRKLIGADSLTYLSLEGLKEVVGDEGHCLACFTGEYPIKPPN